MIELDSPRSNPYESFTPDQQNEEIKSLFEQTFVLPVTDQRMLQKLPKDILQFGLLHLNQSEEISLSSQPMLNNPQGLSEKDLAMRHGVMRNFHWLLEISKISPFFQQKLISRFSGACYFGLRPLPTDRLGVEIALEAVGYSEDNEKNIFSDRGSFRNEYDEFILALLKNHRDAQESKDIKLPLLEKVFEREAHQLRIWQKEIIKHYGVII